MAKRPQSSSNKVILRGEGAGALSWDDAEARAKEIARIAGRRRVTARDREQARAELNNRHLPDTTVDDAESRRSLSRDPSDPPVRRGRRVETGVQRDPQRDVERLVLEGVEEAQHDQMTTARRASRRRTSL
jgi:hypothetical protein